MAVGDLVPLATLGTMPGGMKIERRKLRGEWSNGMLCSGKELGLGDDHAGIMILPST
jgi:phenylalanyl-tRNA synthetase beta chain